MTSLQHSRLFLTRLGDRLSRMQSLRFALKEQVSFSKRLSFLITAGVPLVESLYVLYDQAKNRGQARMLKRIIDDVEAGQSLSRSFTKFPGIFSGFAVSIIKVGESSGTLSESLVYLSQELQKKQKLKRKVVGAFVYPSLIVVATFGITGFLMLYLFPKIMPIFTSLHSQLPMSTRMVMAMSLFLQEWGFVTLGVGIALAIVMAFLVRKVRTIRYVFHSVLMRIPIIGQVVRYYNVANFCRTMGLLLRSGIRVSEGVVITADTIQNEVYKRELLVLAEAVNRGERIATQLKRNTNCFPSTMTHLVAVGEKSGTLAESLTYLSDLYDAEVDDFTKNLSTLIEPALMVLMGIMVGFIAISIITPIYGITQSLHT